jgi:hypothetical protein
VEHAGDHAKVSHGVLELKEEISDSNNNHNANLCYKEDIIQKLVYLLDNFKKLNKSM